MRRNALPFVLLLASCASAPAPPPPAKPPPPPVFVEGARFAPAQMDQLSFECGRAHEGVELRVALLDGRGRELDQREVRAGRAFGGPALVAGRVVRRRLYKAQEGSLKVVGRARPMAVRRSLRLDAAELSSVKLIEGGSCERSSDGQVSCTKLRDPRIARSLRLRRVPDPRRGALEIVLLFNRDFERGVVIKARLVDKAGRVHPRCVLRIEQPTVYETQRKRFRLVVQDAAAVHVLSTIKTLRVVGHHEREPALDGPGSTAQEVRLLCAARPRVRPRSRATIR